jgi:hypothetical protein
MVLHTSLPIHARNHNEVAKSDGCWFLADNKNERKLAFDDRELRAQLRQMSP